MLFPLSQELRCKESGQKVKISNSDMEDKCEDSSDHETDQYEKQKYEDRVNGSRVRAEDQASLLMEQNFDT